MTPEEIIAYQLSLLNECKQEFIAAMNHDSINDYVVESILERIDDLPRKIKNKELTHEPSY